MGLRLVKINTRVSSPKTALMRGGGAAQPAVRRHRAALKAAPVLPMLVLDVSISAQVVMRGCWPCCDCCASCWVFFLRSSCPWAPSQLER